MYIHILMHTCMYTNIHDTYTRVSCRPLSGSCSPHSMQQPSLPPHTLSPSLSLPPSLPSFFLLSLSLSLSLSRSLFSSLSLSCSASVQRRSRLRWRWCDILVAVCCSVLQCVAVCCSVLQCVAVCCSVLQCVVCCVLLRWRKRIICSVLPRVAARCNMLRVAATVGIHHTAKQTNLSLLRFKIIRTIMVSRRGANGGDDGTYDAGTRYWTHRCCPAVSCKGDTNTYMQHTHATHTCNTHMQHTHATHTYSTHATVRTAAALQCLAKVIPAHACNAHIHHTSIQRTPPGTLLLPSVFSKCDIHFYKNTYNTFACKVHTHAKDTRIQHTPYSCCLLVLCKGDIHYSTCTHNTPTRNTHPHAICPFKTCHIWCSAKVIYTAQLLHATHTHTPHAHSKDAIHCCCPSVYISIH